MFMSTVVHLVEFVLLALMGVMLYRLYKSYKDWKVVSVSSLTFTGRKLLGSMDGLVGGQSLKGTSANHVGRVEGQIGHQEKVSSILDDYIDGFFTGVEVVDNEAFDSCDEVASLAISGDADVDGEFIRVQVADSDLLSKSFENDSYEEVSAEKLTSLKESESAAPDTFITVSSSKDESSDKIMSDKVVLAMLDEAKQVCAS